MNGKELQMLKFTTDNKVDIRLARPEDAAQIQEVVYQTWLATYPNEEAGISVDDIEDLNRKRAQTQTPEEREKNLREAPPGQHVLVAVVDEKVVGMCRMIVSEQKNQLKAIYILPEHQGKGIGGKLWYEAQKFIDHNKDTFVEVATYNVGAIGFYEKLGFMDTGRRLSDECFRMKSGAIIPEMEMVKMSQDKLVGYLAMSPHAFDQTPDGWRTLGEHGHEREAIVLIEKYLEAHPDVNERDDQAVWFHLGQMRAMVGDNAGAIVAFEKSKERPSDPLSFLYTEATIAFLRGDIVTLKELVAKYDTEATGDWRMNLPILERLVTALEKGSQNYKQAYGN